MKKFRKYTNFTHLIIAILISILLCYVFLIYDFNIKTSYLFSNAIAIIIFVTLSIIYRARVKKYKKVEATLKKCEYSVLSNCDLTYEFNLDNKQEKAIYHYAQLEKEDIKEMLYITPNNKRIIREKDITLFKKKGLIVFVLIMILFILLGLNFNFNYNGNPDINESFKEILLFKFINTFLIFAIVIFNVVIKKTKIKCTKVYGRVNEFYITTKYDQDEVSGIPTTRTYDMGTPKYEYVWNGQKREYVSNTSSTNIPKIGTTKELFVDKDGIVVREKGGLKSLTFFGFLVVGVYLTALLLVFNS